VPNEKRELKMELVQTLGFHDYFFSNLKSWTPENLRKPAAILAFWAMGFELTG